MMILWRGKEEPETRGSHYPYNAFRWTLQAHASWDSMGLGFVQQGRSRQSQEWSSSHVAVHEVNITRHWAWGSDHIYWDGPHCFYSFGFVHFGWMNWNCKRCRP